MLEITSTNQLKRLIIVGDRVLIKPKNPQEQTRSGLYLPPTIAEKEEVQSGYVVKVGPGYPLPVVSEDEPWKTSEEKVKYMPLQAEEGDLALYLNKHAIQIVYQEETYVIVPQSAILMLERAEDLF
ncbi:MAG: co-chaperone GroES [Spirosomataceae bacterium]